MRLVRPPLSAPSERLCEVSARARLGARLRAALPSASVPILRTSVRLPLRVCASLSPAYGVGTPLSAAERPRLRHLPTGGIRGFGGERGRRRRGEWRIICGFMLQLLW